MGDIMHRVDLSNFNLRTDLIIENNLSKIKNNGYIDGDIEVSDIVLKDNTLIEKKKGKYVTISFKNITDSNDYNHVLKIFIQELKNVITYSKIKRSAKCLIIGLGNKNIISDALGSKVLDNIIVTRHLYLLGNVDKKYRNVSILTPNVMGVTGIDSFDIIESVTKKIRPDFIIAIDALCACNIERLNKVIQISSSGITPGSGIGNTRKELSLDTLGIPVIAIGVPTVVDSTVIIRDSIKYLMRKISYLKKNIHNNVDKIKPLNKINYMKDSSLLKDEEKKELLGLVGLLNEKEFQQLMWEVLSPVDANMIVTTKEIDFLMEKMSKLLSEGINRAIHFIF